MSIDGNGVYRITEVGAYYIAHYNIFTTHFIVERPGCGVQFDLTPEQVKELLKLMPIDYEDGKFLHKTLVGQYLHLTFNEHGIVDSIGDPFAENHISLKA